jgi:outer membrane protein OmpA-like peptidoglycan-associated protein
MNLSVKKEDVDLKKKTLVARASGRAAKAELTVYDEEGGIMDEISEVYPTPPPNSPLRMAWTGAKPVLKMMLRIYDEHGFYNQLELTPWAVDVPHEEVDFDTGKWEVRPDQRPKLETACKGIQEIVKKYSKLITIRLYVAGYTDTVGGNDSNYGLSDNRARSIAGFLHKNCVALPTYYQGFGEDVLAVPTEDNIDEQKNRRAIYTLAAEHPGPHEAIPRLNWKLLK